MVDAILHSLGLSEAVRAGHLRVLVVEAQKAPYVKEIPHTLEDLASLSPGLLEKYYRHFQAIEYFF